MFKPELIAITLTSPWRSIIPSVGCNGPPIILLNVDFHDPLIPTKAIMSTSQAVNDISLSAKNLCD